MTPSNTTSKNSAFVAERVDVISADIERLLADAEPERWFGSKLAKPLRAAVQQGRCTTGTIVRLSLLQDCLRVVERIISHDGVVTTEEVLYGRPLVRDAQAYLAKLRASYDAFEAQDEEGTRHFLEVHQSDRSYFGGACDETRWVGRDLVLRLSKSLGDRGPLESYEELMVRLIDECVAISSDEGEAAEVRAELSSIFRRLGREADNAEEASDPRVTAFCSPEAPEVFHAIAHASDVWRRDPCDVESIHGPARDVYERLLDRAATHPDHGSLLLIKGDSGSGKTHLMRAFRAQAHGSRLGYVGYLQMSSSTDNYGRYVLHKLLDSLEKPYDAPEVQTTGLLGLSDAIVSSLDDATAKRRLTDADLSDAELVELVAELADALVVRHSEERFDIDVLRALLCLQRRDPRLNGRVMKYLRCEPLNGRDQRLVGDLAPKTGAEDPARMLEQIGRVIYRLGQAALVLLVDQLEDIYSQEASQGRFRRAMDVFRALADAVPSAVVVVACLDDFYNEARGALTRSVLDRIEHDPAPIQLTSSRSLEDVEALAERRLAHLYERGGARHREDEPHFPFGPADLQRLVNLRTRDVLEWLRRHHERCIEAGTLLDPDTSSVEAATSDAAGAEIQSLEQRWSDFCAEPREVPDQDEALAQLLAWALSSLAEETDRRIEAKAAGGFVRVELGDDEPSRALLGICNKDPRGGHLGQQVAELARTAEGEERTAGVVRCSAFPSNPKTKIARQLGELIARGGRRLVVEDADWRTMLALRDFERDAPQGLSKWRRETLPLSRIEALRQLAALDEVDPGSSLAAREPASGPAVRGLSPEPPAVAPPPSKAPAAVASPGAVELGTTRSLAPKPVSLPAKTLKRHAAFLGSTGSGKTTFMLHLLEEMLLRGVPALLVDRKGDLVGYARDEFWRAPEADPDRAQRKAALRDKLDVRVYTPGEPSGRDLGIPVVPTQLADLAAHERSQVARQAAAGLGGMMSFKSSQSDLAKLGILSKAIELIAQLSEGDAPSIRTIADFIGSEDALLVNEVGHIDTRHFKKLAENLSTLEIGSRSRLLASGAEGLDVDRLLGTDGSCPAGRARLSVVSTKFLEDIPSVDFWVSRLVLELRRWGSRHPSSNDLPQALVLFDEADMYLPAQRKPATKEPMMDLLKRGRSAGIGVLLATQSPGDLDYKGRDNINTWMLGRIAEGTALGKMKPLLSEIRSDVSGKLATAGVGEFIMVSSGQATELKARRSLMETEQLPEEEILRLAARGG